MTHARVLAKLTCQSLAIIMGSIYSSKLWAIVRSAVDEVHLELWAEISGHAVFYGFAFAGILGIRRDLVIWFVAVWAAGCYSLSIRLRRYARRRAS
jgi:hypothetical protein